MAPLDFWMKRQLETAGAQSDILDLEIPLPSRTLSDTTSQATTGSPSITSSSTTTTSLPSSVSQSSTDSSAGIPTTDTASQSSSSLSDVVSTTTSDRPLVLVPAPTPTPTTSGVSSTPSPTLIRSATVGEIPDVVSSGLPNNVGAASQDNSFLANKVTSGIVFALCGLVGLVIIVSLVFFATRRARRNKKLEEEIISWDPDHVQNFAQPTQAVVNLKPKDDDGRSFESVDEKARGSNGSDSSHHGYTYALPSTTYRTNLNPPHRNHGGQQPIQVAFPPHAQQYPYRRDW